MSLRRGFKAEANRYALDFRRGLNVPADGPLCPWRLAQSLGVPVENLSDVAKADLELPTSLVLRVSGSFLEVRFRWVKSA